MGIPDHHPTVLLCAPDAISADLQSMIADRCELVMCADDSDPSRLDQRIRNSRIEGAILANRYIDRSVRRMASHLERVGTPYLLATASCHQAHLMFELSARDYLLLSMPNDQVKTTLVRFLKSLDATQAGKEPVSHARPDDDVIWVRNGHADRKVRLADIRSVSADKDYAILELGGSSLLVRRTMSSLAQELDPDRFIRIHRSHIVPISAIREIRTPAPNRHELELECGTVFPVGRTYWRSLRELLRNPALSNRTASAG